MCVGGGGRTVMQGWVACFYLQQSVLTSAGPAISFFSPTDSLEPSGRKIPQHKNALCHNPQAFKGAPVYNMVLKSPVPGKTSTDITQYKPTQKQNLGIFLRTS